MHSTKRIIVCFSLVILVFVFGYLVSSYQNRNLITDNNKQGSLVKSPCPYKIGANFPKEYLANWVGETTVSYPPELINPRPEVSVIKKEFKPYEPPPNSSFYTIPQGAYPWSEVGSFDVDKDNQKEKIIVADVAMNHTPHLLKILKDNRIIFEAQGANIWVQEEVSSHNGFLLSQTIDWNTSEYQKTRYIYDNGKFIPVWNQTSCGIVAE